MQVESQTDINMVETEPVVHLLSFNFLLEKKKKPFDFDVDVDMNLS